MTFILGLLMVIAVLASVLLMFVILLQEPKGGGLAAALGGSGMDAIGANVGQVNRFTSILATIWISACFFHAVWQPTGVTVGTTKPSTPAVVPGQAPTNPPREGSR